MLKDMFTNITTKAKDKLQKTAQTVYEKASPEVQKQLDKIISAKVDDVCDIAFAVAGVVIVGCFVLKSVDNSSKTSTDIVPTITNNFDEINITYNYFMKGDK